MTELLEQAIKQIRSLPEARQNELAHFILSFAGTDGSAYQLTDEEEADAIEAEAEIARGELATDAEVQAVFAKFRP